MRPGPGLVVMALAFISGARRGSTSSISSKTTTTTTSSPPPPPLTPPSLLQTPSSLLSLTLHSPGPFSPQRQTATSSSSAPPSSSTSHSSAIISPTAATAPAATANTITATTSPPFGLYEHFDFLGSQAADEEEILGDDRRQSRHHRHRHHHPYQDPVSFEFFATFYTKNHNSNTKSNNNNNKHHNSLQRSSSKSPTSLSSSSLLSSFAVSSHSPYSPYYSSGNHFAYSFPLPSQLSYRYDDPRARSESARQTVLPSVRHPRRVTAKFHRRRKRRTRSASVSAGYKGAGGVDVAAAASDNLNESDDSASQSTAVDSGSSDQTLGQGLPVHFPSHLSAAASAAEVPAADTSRSFDEDDIFALVAEDDLLSEESFDRLIKLTDDKIGDTNEEDYSSGTETVVSSSSASGTVSGSGSSSSSASVVASGSGSGPTELQDISQHNALEDYEGLQQSEQPPHSDTSATTLVSASGEGGQEPSNEHDTAVETLLAVSVVQQQQQQALRSENSGKEQAREDEAESPYRAQLVGSHSEEVVTITGANVATDTISEAQTEHIEDTLDTHEGHRSILDSGFPLTRLNPWISACDLAQPGPLSAPDLQGECSAGTLPVAWVDEGPGPPKCLKSCRDDEDEDADDDEEETPFTTKLNKDNAINTNAYNKTHKNNNNNNNPNNNNNKHKNNKNDNKLHNKLVGYTATTNTFNVKLRNSQPTISHSSTNNQDDDDNNHSSSGGGGSAHPNRDISGSKRAKPQRSQKLLNPFTYYQRHRIHASAVAKTRRNSNDSPPPPPAPQPQPALSAPAQASAAAGTATAEIAAPRHETISPANATGNSSSAHLLHAGSAALHELMQQHHTSDDAVTSADDVDDVTEDDIDLNVHNDAAVADNAAFLMQLQQFQHKQLQHPQQNQANNNIVKMKLTSRAGGSHITELKFNHVKADSHAKQYHGSTYQIQFKGLNSDPGSATQDASEAEKQRQQQQQQKQQQQQQCLEYLGDSAETMPMHLCTQLNTPSQLLAQLRHLRLRNCCERNVYSALHTLALNATLEGGEQCVTILQDLMDLDAMASRITCGLAEILFRFDCRQVYSIIHQCEDCKEAYRRWVCSTLVPYFAEPSDVVKPDVVQDNSLHAQQQRQQQHMDAIKTQHINTFDIRQMHLGGGSSNNTNMASNMTTSHLKHNNTSTNTNTNITSGSTSSIASSGNNKGMDTLASAIDGAPLVAATSNFLAATQTNNENNNHNGDVHYVQQQQQQQQQQHRLRRRDTALQEDVEQQALPQHAFHMLPAIQLYDKSNNNYITKESSSSNNNNNYHNYGHELMHKRRAKLPPATISATAAAATAAATTSPWSLSLPSSSSSAVTLLANASLPRTRALTFDDIIFLNNYAAGLSLAPALERHNVHDGISQSAAADGQNYHNKSTNNKPRRKRNFDDSSAVLDAADEKTFYATGNMAMVQDRQPQAAEVPQQAADETATQKQQSFNSISTANSEDSSFVKRPVISKLLQRSKRKVEFRKRRRIRPCLSVCQTVEQKCPYLLPADRAPAMPTQYAGEPTFLCLDYNIAETEEQLRKASHGPNDCCYTYCTNAADGICTYCNEFLDSQDIELEAERISKQQEKRVYNITLRARGQEGGEQSIRVETKIQQKLADNEPPAKHLQMSTVAIAVRNDTVAQNVSRLMERLQYYAYCDGIYYYDEDTDDMPKVPYSEDCIALPGVQSRCTIPYYASNYITSGELWSAQRRHLEAQRLLLWLGTLLCLWSCYTTRVLRLRRLHQLHHQRQPLTPSTQQQDLQLGAMRQPQDTTTKPTNNTAFNRKLNKCNNTCDELCEIKQDVKDLRKSVTVWYDVGENRILFTHMQSERLGETCNAGVVRQARRSHRSLYEIVRRTQRVELRHGKSVLILLIHYTNRLKAFMQRTRPHRKRKLTRVDWASGRRALMWSTQCLIRQLILIMKLTSKRRNRKCKQLEWARRRQLAISRRMQSRRNRDRERKQNCSNVSFSQCSCSLSSCRCNHINNNYDNTNNYKNRSSSGGSSKNKHNSPLKYQMRKENEYDNMRNNSKHSNSNNKNNNKNNSNYNYENMKKMKFNFSTCNFKNTNTKYNNNNNYYYYYINYHYYDFYHHYERNAKSIYNSYGSRNNHHNNNNSHITNLISKPDLQHFSINKKSSKATETTTTRTHSKNQEKPSHQRSFIDFFIGRQRYAFTHLERISRNHSFPNSSLTNFFTLRPTLASRGHWAPPRPPGPHQCDGHHLAPSFHQLSYNSKLNNYHYFYDFDFDINDCWPRYFIARLPSMRRSASKRPSLSLWLRSIRPISSTSAGGQHQQRARRQCISAWPGSNTPPDSTRIICISHRRKNATIL